MTQRIKILHLLIILWVAVPVYGQQLKEGLFFYSHERNIDGRTSLLLNNNEPYELKSEDLFSADMTLALRNETIKFGYVFRMIFNEKNNVDFIVNNKSQAFLVVNNQDFPLKETLSADRWHRLSIVFRKQQNRITLRLNDEEVECPVDLKSWRSLRIVFGQCDIRDFSTNDVAPIVLKDVAISYNDKPFHHWVLNRHAENKVFDELRKRPALALNPQWQLDRHACWEKLAEFQATTFPQFTFDSINNRVFMLNSNELIEYSIVDRTERRIRTRPDICGKYYNHLMFDALTSRLFFYSLDEQQLSFYDLKTNRWDGYRDGEIESAHAHHNRYISGTDSCLYLFGGYGFYQYNSDLFKVDLRTGQWHSYDLSHLITPRYLAAVGGSRRAGENRIYILGGRGSEMGRQELSPRNFSDLYEIDLNTLKGTCLFDIGTEDEKENVYSNSLVVDADGKTLYALAYPNRKYASAIALKKIDRETQTVETVGDSLAYYFQDITSFCDLYYAPKLSKLVAVVSFSSDEAHSRIHIYTLDYPPLKNTEIRQEEATITPSLNRIIFIFFGLIAVVLLSFFLRKTLVRKNTGGVEAAVLPPREPGERKERKEREKSPVAVLRNAILFLGGFQVFNKTGGNITGEFTPTLKNLLVLIILYTLKNNKGISSSRLQELLWFNKSEEAARNNRNVNLRKLRVLLEELDGVDISGQSGYWTITLPGEVFSDYKEILACCAGIRAGEAMEKDEVLRLLNLLDYGQLLPNIQLEWVDSFKTEFTNAVIDALMKILGDTHDAFYGSDEIRLKIADALLKMDSLSDEALRIKCRTLVGMGKKGQAKAAFDSFRKEYQLLLGEPYAGSLEKILE
ncbi:MAG: hypothetical protein LBH61_06070 [Dysgonamonadaceae bacterium]|jgi:DNA-binding SARP family transcriptional activator|nr:hypothetical protein [Dysgonamonadaceae bacterium]